MNDGPDEAQECAGLGAGSGGHSREHENCGPNESERRCRGASGQEEPGFWNQTYFGVANNEDG